MPNCQSWVKRFIGNDIGKWLVLAISTNALPEDFEEALTREGRLTSFFISPPSKYQIAKMWEHFLSKYKVLNVNKKQANELAEISTDINGALISKFCESYFSHKRNQLLVERGYNSLLESLKDGVDIKNEEVSKAISYDGIKDDLVGYIRRLIIRTNGNNENPISFGFGRKD